MKGVWVLFVKEFKASRSSFLVIIGFLCTWILFLHWIGKFWDQDLILILSLLPLGALPFFSLASGITSLSGEWQKQTIVVLRMLPLKGTVILGVKLLTIFSMILLFTALVVTGSSLLGKGLIPPEISISLRALLVFGISISMLAFALLSQFAYVCGRMFNRMSALVSIWVFLLSVWGLGRLATLIVPLFARLPHLSLRTSGNAGSEALFIPIIEVNPGPFLATTAGIVLFFFIESWLVERYVEL